jgi:hypothetical protein
VTTFRGIDVPDNARPAGYAWLIETYALHVPTPPRLAAIAGRHRPREAGAWHLLPDQYEPSAELGAHLAFALKWEGVNLAVLDALFRAAPAESIADVVRATPTGAQARRLWFLYEWLRDERLDLPDTGKIKAVPVVDDSMQFALADGALSKRHRVRNNLPGTPAFCPMVRRTPALNAMTALGLRNRVMQVIGAVHADVLARAAAFLLLSDSRASYGIEGETPSPDRARRWAQTIARAGATKLSITALEELQRIVIGDARFVRLGLRTNGGFVGSRDRFTQTPLPDHISARWQDLPSLVDGIVAYDQRAATGEMDAVVAAAVEAFGFVYVHPFEDGNGRVHRWLLHHALAASGFAPTGLVFPVSAVMLREIDAYRRELESYSAPLLACIRWQPTESGNVEVLNETASWYRYFDATAHAEFLYRCVQATVESDLPHEVAYLRAYDAFVASVTAMVDMPASTLDLLHRFLRQNDGQLSQRARDWEFKALTDAETARIEAIFADSMRDVPPTPAGFHAPTPSRDPDA